MLNQIVIEKNYLSNQIAIIRDNEFTRFYMNTIFSEDVQNKIVVGQVTQVVKNINAVFIDFGSNKNGILHFKQIPQDVYSKINVGTKLPVQIMKQNTGEKGHKLTAKVNLSGKFFVFMPFERGINISRKIKDSKRKHELKCFVEKYVGEKYGVIVRTHAETQSESELIEDINKLSSITDTFMQTKDYFEKGTVLYQEPPFHIQVIRENINKDNKYEIVCDDENYLYEIKKDIDSLYSTLNINYKLCKEPEGIFSVYGVEKKRTELFNRRVWLKNGGNLIIDYTEAMTVIDVNSAKSGGRNSYSKNALSLNMLAIKECVFQIMLRNLSGMILVDLVEMYDEDQKKQVYEYTKDILKKYGDKRTKVFPLTELGILQFSRTKKYQSLPQQLYESCTNCYGVFGKKSNYFLSIIIEKKIKEISMRTEISELFIKLNEELFSFFKDTGLIQKLSLQYSVQIYPQKCDKKLDNEFEITFIGNND